MWEGVGWCGAASTVTTSGVGTSAVAGISIGWTITICVTEVFQTELSGSSLVSPGVVTGVTSPSVTIPNNDCMIGGEPSLYRQGPSGILVRIVKAVVSLLGT